MFDHPSFEPHERVVFAHDASATGALYAADHAINAGGIISVDRHYSGGATAESIAAEIHRIPARLTEFFARSSADNRGPSELADDLARQLLLEAR